MELFDTSQYSTGLNSDFQFEQQSLSKKAGRQFVVDPAWEDGSAFPESSKNLNLVAGDCPRGSAEGNRVLNPAGKGGEIQKASRAKYTILWDNGFSAEYTPKQFEQYGYQKAVDETEGDCPLLRAVRLCRAAGSGDCPRGSAEGDRWNPDDFNSTPAYKADDGQLTIFFDDGHEPPEPDDFKSIAEYEEAWKQWENSNNSICAAELALGFPLQELNSEDSSSSGLQKQTNTVQTSLSKDSQKSLTTETCMNSLPSGDAATNHTVLPHRHPASHSAYKESDSQPKKSATVSPQSSKSLKGGNPNFLRSKMLEVCSVADIAPNPITPTLDFYSLSFPAAGTMLNGSLYQAEPLERPFLGKDSSWLESPTALSSIGRAPGLSKLESSLIKTGVLARGQVINPIFLEESFGIPPGWTDPWDCRPATELLEEEDKHLGMHLTPEWERSPLEESNTYTQLPPSEPELIPEIFSEETKKDRRRGCLYKYLENKKLKNGVVASYPRVMGERDPDNPKHWRWGFNWEEKIDGQWKNRSLGCVPVGAIPMIQSMQKSDVPLQEIIGFIRRLKGKRNAMNL